MKRMKSGFTLAEVLITLGIIGVIAAIVMPSVMTNYTYKTVGVKLSKFAAQLEGATRPYVVQNNTFTDEANSVNAFIEESFIVKAYSQDTEKTIDCTKTGNERTNEIKAACGNNTSTNDLKVKNVTAGTAPTYTEYEEDGEGATLVVGDDDANIVTLKDGTRFQAFLLESDYEEAPEINAEQVGEAIWGIAFDPMVSGLPKRVNKAYRYVVTELGYVYPDRVNDECMGAMYDANFETNTKFFSDNCVSGHKAAEAESGGKS